MLKLRRLLTIFTLIFLLQAGMLGATAAESYYIPPKADLPDVIFSFPGGEVTRKQLIAAVLRSSRQTSPGTLPTFRQTTPAEFLNYILQDMLLKKKKITDIEEETGRRLVSFAQEAGGDAKLDENLRTQARPPLTRADFYRQIRRQVIAERTGFNALTPQQLEVQFMPRWYGTGQAVAASAGGSDLTNEDLADYLLREAGDAELENVLQELINRRIILAETKKMGSNDEEISTQAALELIFAPFAEREALLAYYQRNQQEYQVYKLREFAFSSRLLAGQNPGQNLTTPQERAKELAKQLVAGGEIMTLLSTGRLRYAVATDMPAQLLPPTAYGLDYSYDTGGQEITPFVSIPQSRREALTGLQPGKTSETLPVDDGCILYYCEEILTPKNPEKLLDVLKARSLMEQHLRLLNALTAPGRASWNWKPESRIPPGVLYPATVAPEKNALPPAPAQNERETLPEIE